VPKNPNWKQPAGPSVDWEELALQAMCLMMDVLPPPRHENKAIYKKKLRNWVITSISENLATIGVIEPDPELPDNWFNLCLTSLVTPPCTLTEFQSGVRVLRTQLNIAEGGKTTSQQAAEEAIVTKSPCTKCGAMFTPLEMAAHMMTHMVGGLGGGTQSTQMSATFTKQSPWWGQ